MRKKYGVVVSIMLALVLLLSTLVACVDETKKEKNKGVIPTSGAVDASEAVADLFETWMLTNSYYGDNVMGWDVSFDYKNEDKSSITILFKGGITSDSNDDCFELSVIDNKSTETDKTIVGLVLDKNAMYVNLMGKSFKAEELGLANVGIYNTTEEGFGNAVSSISTVLNLLCMVADDQTSSVEILKVGEKYTKNYNISLDIWSFLESMNIYDLLVDAMDMDPAQAKKIVDAVQALLENNIIKISGSIDNLELVETTNETEETIYYSYDFEGGSIITESIKLGLLDKNKSYHDIAIGGLKITNTLPTLSIPENSISISLLKHQLTGSFKMKSVVPASEGVEAASTTVSTYDYKINLEFSADNFIGTIIECINAKSVSPLINKILLEQDGKIYIDVYHECTNSCVQHMSTTSMFGKPTFNFKGSVFTLAYDSTEEAFNNNKVYIAAHLKTLLPNNILSALGLTSTEAGLVKPAIPKEYVSIVLDPLVIMESAGMVTGNSSGAVNPPAPPTEGGINVKDLITKMIQTLSAPNGTVEIDFTALTNILLNDLNLDKATKDMITKIIGSMFPTVNVLAVNANYTNGIALPEGFNGKTEFMLKDKKGTAKNFASSFMYKTQPHPMIGDFMYTNMIDENNVKMNSSILYDELGVQKNISYKEVLNMITNDNATVSAKYNTVAGSVVDVNMKLLGIIGLDETKIGVAQSVKLVLGRSGNSTIFDLLDLVGSLGAEFMPELAMVNDLRIPDAVVNTTITIHNVTDSWTQEGIGTEENHIDSVKEYTKDDLVVSTINHNKSYTDNDGNVVGTTTEVLESIGQADIFTEANIETGLRAFKNFNVNKVNYKTLDGFYTYEIAVKFDTQSITEKRTLDIVTGGKVFFGLEQTNALTGNIITLNADMYTKLWTIFQESNPDISTFEIVVTDNVLVSADLVIYKAGTYTVIIKGIMGDFIEYTINVTGEDLPLPVPPVEPELPAVQ